MNKTELKIDWASHESAKFACENWHYSKTIPPAKCVRVGAWENNVFIGVVIFARGASPALLKPYKLDQDQGCELVRVALNKHQTPVSRIMRFALQFLKKTNPNLRLIVSFADPTYGHHGGIYQAGNWVYVGDSAPSKEFWYKGKRIHARHLSEKGYEIVDGVKRKTKKPSECVVVKTVGKHRYLMPLDDEMRAKIAQLAKPYPKRPKQAEPGPPGMRRGSTDPDAPSSSQSE